MLVDVLTVVQYLGARCDQWHEFCQLFAEVLNMILVNLEEGKVLMSLWEAANSVCCKCNSAGESMVSLQDVTLNVVQIQRSGCGSHC